jgi:hypothetical protein
MSLHTAGNIDVRKKIKKITLSPTRATKYRKVVASVEKFREKDKFKKHTSSKDLCIFEKLIYQKYEVIHAANKNIYPCYCLLKNAKQELMNITETCAEINLQDLLDHTSLRLCKYLE